MSLKYVKPFKYTKQCNKGLKHTSPFIIPCCKATKIFQSIKKTLGAILNNFCTQFFVTLGLASTSQKLTADFYYDRHDHRAGFFDPADNKIAINLRFISCADQVTVFTNLIYNDMARLLASPGFIELYAPKVGYTPTLVHELEHARRHTSHTQINAHSDGLNEQGELTNFDACANSFANAAIQGGLLNVWASKVLQVYRDCDYSLLLSALHPSNNILVHEVEAADKEWFLRELGY